MLSTKCVDIKSHVNSNLTCYIRFTFRRTLYFCCCFHVFLRKKKLQLNEMSTWWAMTWSVVIIAVTTVTRGKENKKFSDGETSPMIKEIAMSKHNVRSERTLRKKKLKINQNSIETQLNLEAWSAVPQLCLFIYPRSSLYDCYATTWILRAAFKVNNTALYETPGKEHENLENCKRGST